MTQSASRKSIRLASSASSLLISSDKNEASVKELWENSVVSPNEAITDSTFISSSLDEPTRRSRVTTAALVRVGYSMMRATTMSP